MIRSPQSQGDSKVRVNGISNLTLTAIEEFEKNIFTRWRLNNEKAAKDIVGEEYENLRKRFYNQFGLSAAPAKIGDFNADLVVRDKKGKVCLIEECKGHYVDSCFLDRFLMNVARVLNFYLQESYEEKDIPYFFLSSMTKYSNFQKKFDSIEKLFNEEIRNLITKKVKYFSFCDHDRVSRNKYFKNNKSGFDVSALLIEEQENFIKEKMLVG